MDAIERCSKCKMDCLKTNFHKDKNRKHGVKPHRISCRTQN